MRARTCSRTNALTLERSNALTHARSHAIRMRGRTESSSQVLIGALAESLVCLYDVRGPARQAMFFLVFILL
jgi:hypothetical protein